jgi:hypothetical protein
MGIIYEAEGDYFTSPQTGKHKMQHRDSPTWCVNCGDFDRNCGNEEIGYDCTKEHTGKFDTRTPEGFSTVAKIMTGVGSEDPMPENICANKGLGVNHHKPLL